MKTGITLAMVFLVINSISLCAQTKKKWTPADIVAKAKPGLWVELEGTVQEDLSVLAAEIKFLTGDFLDDDWELKAPVRTVTPSENEFQVLMMQVRVTKTTDFEKGINGIEDIKPGMVLELEGTYLKDGIFLAKEIENITDRLKGKPQLDARIEAIGKIGQVDEIKRVIMVMGTPFYITDKTEGKSPIN